MNGLVRVLVGSLLLAGTSAYAGPATPAVEKGVCDADLMRSGAALYMEAMIHGGYDPSRWDNVPLAPNVRRVEHPPGTYNGTPARGGPVTGKTADGVKSFSLALPTVRVATNARDHTRLDRIFVNAEVCEIVVFWLIDLGMRSADGSPPENFGTVHVAERFRFQPADHKISQIEAFFFQEFTPNAWSCWPPEGEEGTAAACTTTAPPVREHCAPSSDWRMRAAVQSYLDALVSHSAAGVELADDVRRTEMPWPAGGGPVTATNADQVRASLEQDERFAKIKAVRDARWFVNRHDCTVVVFYLIDTPTTPTNEQVQPGMDFTVHVAQRFHVSQGRITEIEHVAYPHQNTEPEGSCWTGFDPNTVVPGSPEDTKDYTYMTVPCPAGY